MNTFIRFFYEFISIFFDGILTIFKGIAGGISQIVNIKHYMQIIDSYKNVLVEYRYDAWGNVETIYDETFFSLSSINIYYYRGYRYDIETSLYYCNARYYNPEWGRW
jgi:hypothetical protein